MMPPPHVIIVAAAVACLQSYLRSGHIVISQTVLDGILWCVIYLLLDLYSLLRKPTK